MFIIINISTIQAYHPENLLVAVMVLKEPCNYLPVCFLICNRISWASWYAFPHSLHTYLQNNVRGKTHLTFEMCCLHTFYNVNLLNDIKSFPELKNYLRFFSSMLPCMNIKFLLALKPSIAILEWASKCILMFKL